MSPGKTSYHCERKLVGMGGKGVIFGAATTGRTMAACRTTTIIRVRSLLTSFCSDVTCVTLLLSCTSLFLLFRVQPCRCYAVLNKFTSWRRGGGVWGVGLRVAQDERKLQALLDQAKGKPGLKVTRKKLKKAIQHLVRACSAARAPSSSSRWRV